MASLSRCLLAALLVLVAPLASAERIKDLVSVAGVRTNQLVGYGLVVGLDGSGDQTSQAPFTTQSLKSMLQQFGITIPPNVTPQTKNIAAVSVHAELPPFAKPGQKIDITISSIGNAKSLRGGSLLLTPLKGADGQVYAVAQGNLVVSGFGAEAKDGSKITVNVPSAGRIPGGATVERSVPTAFAAGDSLTLNLHTGDFTTAARMVEVINKAFGANSAQPLDATSVRVAVPADSTQRVAYLSMLENLTLEPGESASRVVINSRTGTIVIGKHVRVMPAAVAHGSLTVAITERAVVSQPGAFSSGTTEVVDRSDIVAKEENARMFMLREGVTLEEIVNAVNRVGAAPGDLVAILEALRNAGALRAELVVI
jgi:flagellar P-ring protein precursor FlgI